MSGEGERSQVKQISDRGSNDWLAVSTILDAGFLATVAFVVDGQPFAIPMLYGRSERSLFLHGAAASRLMNVVATGAPACVTVTMVDGLVLARSAFHHSMNYRSVVAFGSARLVTDRRAKVNALRCISDHLLAGRWTDVRGPNKRELESTAVLEMPIEESSAKLRAGPPSDDPADYRRPTWAGVLPLRIIASSPIPDECTGHAAPLPHYLTPLPDFCGSESSPDACE
jgi:nitroimidazol reductase NimA-like FMN-containing flavoprotein (pyridoxamine 5'-phosphate oxidase superfamily)